MHITRNNAFRPLIGWSLTGIRLRSQRKYTPERLSWLVFSRKSTPGKKEINGGHMHNANTEIPTLTAELRSPEPSSPESDNLETDSEGRLLAPVAVWEDNRVICSHELSETPTRKAHRCGSPALRGESFCYYHHPTRAIVRNPHERRARRIARQAFTIPAPTCHADIQRSLGEIARRLYATASSPLEGISK